MTDSAPSSALPKRRPVVLCIMDGFGWREDPADNAVRQAKTPNFDKLWSGSPRGFLKASGHDVGLPDGQIGNSEVGHMNIGAGRVVYQDLPRIDKAIADGDFAKNPVLLQTFEKIAAGTGRLHLLGLASPGGVHAHQRHIAALARLAVEHKLTVALHLFTDGRDVPPQSAKEQVAALLKELDGVAGVSVATVSGRYFAMDRDHRWDREEKAWRALVLADSPHKAPDALAAIQASYDAGKTDEFVEPTVIAGYEGMADGDGLIMANFRSDRAREILMALLEPDFDGFARPRTVAFSAQAGMVSYSSELDRFMPALLPPKELTHTFGQVVSEAGLTQLRMAETEKYPHVTFFFNGGLEEPVAGEERIMVPSPKVATYDLQPEMSAPEVTEKLAAAVRSQKFDAIVINYANPDMVGHTGSLPAAVKAVETVDAGVGELLKALEEVGGCAFITADHGNCELMKDPETGGPHTAHTLNLVPAVLFNPPPGVTGLVDGRLADIAPTLLALLGLPQPKEMDGHSLLKLDGAATAAAE